MRFARPFFHRHAPLPDSESGSFHEKLSNRSGFFRYLSPLSRPEHHGAPRLHSPADPAPTPKWIEHSLIALAVVLAAFTVLHQPKPFSPVPVGQHVAVAAATPLPASLTKPHPPQQTASSPVTAHPARPVATDLPRDVTIARDLSVTVEYGVVGLRKGQPVQLVDRTDFGYYAVYEDYLLPIKDGDFE